MSRLSESTHDHGTEGEELWETVKSCEKLRGANGIELDATEEHCCACAGQGRLLGVESWGKAAVAA